MKMWKKTKEFLNCNHPDCAEESKYVLLVFNRETPYCKKHKKNIKMMNKKVR